MKRALPGLLLLLAPSASADVPGQIDSVCRERCSILAVQDGSVRYVDQWQNRNVLLGQYAAEAQHLVPRTEAPVRDLRSPNGWRVVASVYLDHEGDEILVRLRFFGPDGSLRGTGEVLWYLEQTIIGNLFGGTDAIFAVTSNEEHAYNAQTEIWFLPERGIPKFLLGMQGYYQTFSDGGGKVGVTVARQTYDGVDAKTKGTVQEFWRWDRKRKVLTRDGR